VLIVIIITLTTKADINKIIPYSLRNRYTNINLPISILNPLINSLSPSNKSKGARFPSIKMKINITTSQTTDTSKVINLNEEKENLDSKDKHHRKAKIKATS